MRRSNLLVIVAVGLIFGVSPCQAQEKEKEKKKNLLATTGWGSLSGKVTLDGKIPDIVDLVPRMKMHADGPVCCLAPKAKPIEKIDSTWLVDPKTKAVANVVVWIKAPPNTYFPLPPNYKPSKEPIIIDQPHCAFLPRVSAYNPINIIEGGEKETGQKVLFKNSAVVPHNVRAIGSPDKNPGFNTNVRPKSDQEKSFAPQLLPINLQCDVHSWMAAKLHVFNHPYFAITKEDGTFEIPQVPAGAQISIMAYHEGVGWVFVPEYAKGRPVTLKAGKNVFDFQVKAPPPK